MRKTLFSKCLGALEPGGAPCERMTFGANEASGGAAALQASGASSPPPCLGWHARRSGPAVGDSERSMQWAHDRSCEPRKLGPARRDEPFTAAASCACPAVVSGDAA